MRQRKVEFVLVNLLAGEHRHPEFLHLNPAGKVPVLVDDDIVIPESAAIVLAGTLCWLWRFAR